VLSLTPLDKRATHKQQPQVAGAWYALTQAYRASRPDLAAFVLGSAGRYVHWMDIGLVANDK
jgi:hypothetical protein